MTAPAWFVTAGLVTAPSGSAAASLAGAFDRPPVVQWISRLPGPGVAAGSHAELGRPVIHDDTIFVGSAGDDALYVVNRTSAQTMARLPAGGPVQAAVVIDGDRLYFSDAGGYTWCYTLESALAGGDPKWSHYSGAPVLASPTVHAGRVYVANVANQVVALDADDGSLAWRHAQRLDPSRSIELELYGAPAPVPAESPQPVVLCGFSDGTVAALGQVDGDVVWQRRVGEGRYPDIIGQAWVQGGHAVVGGFEQPLLSLDMATRNVRWRLDDGGASRVAPGVGGVIFQGGGDGVLRAIDGNDGVIAWEWDSETGGALTEPIPTPAGVLVGSPSGSLYLVDADDGALIWTMNIGRLVSGVTVAPAIDGRQAVVLTNAGNLISLVVPETTPEWARERGVLTRAAKGGPKEPVPEVGGR